MVRQGPFSPADTIAGLAITGRTTHTLSVEVCGVVCRFFGFGLTPLAQLAAHEGPKLEFTMIPRPLENGPGIRG
jgi:hypothetical protein